MDRQSFDRAYLERLRHGDVETERHFYAYFGELILIKARARRSAQVEDVRQETFMRVLRTLRSPEGLRDPGALGAFVNSVCNNVLMESGRAVRRYDSMPDECDTIPDHSSPGPEAQAMTHERQEIVRRVLESLPERDRELLRAIFLDERDKDQVCEQFGVTRDYLRVLLHRAKNLFRAVYKEQEAAAPEAVPSEGPRRRAGGAVVW